MILNDWLGQGPIAVPRPPDDIASSTIIISIHCLVYVEYTLFLNQYIKKR